LPSGISPQCQCGWFSKEFVTSLHFDLIKACFVAGLFTGCFVCLFIYIYSLTSLAGLYICLMIAHIICLKKKKKIYYWICGVQRRFHKSKDTFKNGGVILTLFVHNNDTTPRHIGVGPNVWTPLQCALVLCHCCGLWVFWSFLLKMRCTKKYIGDIKIEKC
jgi:hypothetical protein